MSLLKNKDNKKVISIFFIVAFLVALLIATVDLFFFMGKGTSLMEQAKLISVCYGIVTVLSLCLVFGYCYLLRKRDIWFLVLFISVFIVNLGYLALSISSGLSEALLANRISYLGSVFLPLSMLMIIMNVCKINHNKYITSVLIAVSLIVFIIAGSSGYLDLYYKEVSLVFVDGVAKLEKVYGPLHNVYYIYLLSYFAVMFLAIVKSFLQKRLTSPKQAIILAMLVFFNIVVWFYEQQVSVDFEFLSITYVLTELFLLFMYYNLQEKAELIETETKEKFFESEVETKPLENNEGVVETKEKPLAFPEKVIEEIMATSPYVKVLTAREREVLALILKNEKRKDIAKILFVSENTVKKHTSHIFAKLGVTNRKELFARISERITI